MLWWYTFITVNTYRGSNPTKDRHSKFGLEAWFKHFVSWKKHANLIVTYEAMRKNTYEEFQKVLHFLGVTCSDDVILSAIERASLSSVRKIEKTKGLTGGKLTAIRFTDYAKEGVWREWFTDSV